MARPKKVVEESVEKKIKVECSCCGKNRILGYFYKSNSRMNTNRKKMTICKDCLLQICRELIEESKDMKVGIYRTCMYIDVPFFEKLLISAFDEVTVQDGEKRDISDDIDSQVKVFQLYMKNVNSLNQYDGLSFENGEGINVKQEIGKMEDDKQISNTNDRDRQNEVDVIRILGYDPFETENKKDRKFLFNRLVDMLDDSTLGDNIKLMSVISIVKGFNQVEYIDQAIASFTRDTTQLGKNNGGIKSLIDTKKNLMQTILKTCEDNGISSKHNTNKAKGAGTLTGMVKELGEMNLKDSEVNLFDIQTAEGMQQCADMSNSSIKKQLQFDENDYSEMVAWQRDELYKLQQRESRLTEDNRLLKIRIKESEDELRKMNL